VTDVDPRVVEAAIRVALDSTSDKPRVVVQGRNLWKSAINLPQWKWFHELLPRQMIDVIDVGRGLDDKLLTTPLNFPPRHQSLVAPTPSQVSRRAAAIRCIATTVADLPAVFESVAEPLLRAQNLPDLPAAADEALVLDEILSGLARGDAEPFQSQYRAVARLYFTDEEILRAQREFVPPPSVP
jgi:hypothetical protein